MSQPLPNPDRYIVHVDPVTKLVMGWGLFPASETTESQEVPGMDNFAFPKEFDPPSRPSFLDVADGKIKPRLPQPSHRPSNIYHAKGAFVTINLIAEGAEFWLDEVFVETVGVSGVVQFKLDKNKHLVEIKNPPLLDDIFLIRDEIHKLV